MLPATWTDGIEKWITASERFTVQKSGTTGVQVPAGNVGGTIGDLGPAGIIIDGKPRWVEATVTRAMAGGAGAGTYDVYVVAAANEFAAGAPAVGEVDNTFYGFELRIVTAGAAEPAGNLANGKLIAHTRKVRQLQWDGSAVTTVLPLVREDHLAVETGLLLNADVRLYRSAAAVASLTGDLRASADVRARDGAAGQLAIGNQGPSSQAGIKGGSAGDVNLYRSAVDTWKTDDALTVGPITSVSAGGGGLIGVYLAAGGAVAVVRSSAGTVLRAGLTTDTQDRFSVSTDGVLAWGAGGASATDADLSRSAAGILSSTSVFSPARLNVPAQTSGVASYRANQVAAQPALSNYLLAADSVPAFRVYGDGKHEWGAGGASAADVNLYRSAVATLKTDGGFRSVGDQVARDAVAAGQTLVGAGGPASEAGIKLGSPGDTNFYRSAAGVLKTDGALTAGPITSVAAGGGGLGGVFLASGGAVNIVRAVGATALRLGLAADTVERLSVTTDGALSWGPGGAGALDVTLYRSAADTLKTDDTFRSALDVYARDGAATQVRLGAAGPASEAGITFGSAGDTNLYRALAGLLKTSGSFQAVGNIHAQLGAAAQVFVGQAGPANQAGLTLGTSADTVLYRSAVDTLRTPDSLVVDGELTVGTTTFTQSLAPYRTIAEVTSFALGGAGPGPHVMMPGWQLNGLQMQGGGLFRIDPAAYTMTGRTPNARITVAAANNATGAGVTATLALQRVTAVAGGAGLPPTPTLAGGSATAVTANLVGGGLQGQTSADFDLSALTAGYYVFTITFSGATAANSYLALFARLEVRYT